MAILTCGVAGGGGWLPGASSRRLSCSTCPACTPAGVWGMVVYDVDIWICARAGILFRVLTDPSLLPPHPPSPPHPPPSPLPLFDWLSSTPAYARLSFLHSFLRWKSEQAGVSGGRGGYSSLKCRCNGGPAACHLRPGFFQVPFKCRWPSAGLLVPPLAIRAATRGGGVGGGTGALEAPLLMRAAGPERPAAGHLRRGGA